VTDYLVGRLAVTRQDQYAFLSFGLRTAARVSCADHDARRRVMVCIF
jgi:hypothetical protein